MLMEIAHVALLQHVKDNKCAIMELVARYHVNLQVALNLYPSTLVTPRPDFATAMDHIV